jgi:tetratricopeptide (TPR) repeat protein
MNNLNIIGQGVGLGAADYFHEKAVEMLSKAKEFKKNQVFDKCLQSLDESLQLDSSFSEARLIRAELLASFGSFEKAASDVDLVLSDNKEDAYTLLLASSVYFSLGSKNNDSQLIARSNEFLSAAKRLNPDYANIEIGADKDISNEKTINSRINKKESSLSVFGSVWNWFVGKLICPHCGSRQAAQNDDGMKIRGETYQEWASDTLGWRPENGPPPQAVFNVTPVIREYHCDGCKATWHEDSFYRERA